MNTKPRPAPPGGASAVAHTLTGNDAAALTLNVAEHPGSRRSGQVRGIGVICEEDFLSGSIWL